MEYSKRGGQHLDYAHSISDKLGQLNLNSTRKDIGSLSGNYGGRNNTAGYVPKAMQDVSVQQPAAAAAAVLQQQQQVFQSPSQDLHTTYSSQRMTYNNRDPAVYNVAGSSHHHLLRSNPQQQQQQQPQSLSSYNNSTSSSSSSSSHLSSSAPTPQHKFSPHHHHHQQQQQHQHKSATGLSSPFSTPSQSQNSSPLRSSSVYSSLSTTSTVAGGGGGVGGGHHFNSSSSSPLRSSSSSVYSSQPDTTRTIISNTSTTAAVGGHKFSSSSCSSVGGQQHVSSSSLSLGSRYNITSPSLVNKGQQHLISSTSVGVGGGGQHLSSSAPGGVGHLISSSPLTPRSSRVAASSTIDSTCLPVHPQLGEAQQQQGTTGTSSSLSHVLHSQDQIHVPAMPTLPAMPYVPGVPTLPVRDQLTGMQLGLNWSSRENQQQQQQGYHSEQLQGPTTSTNTQDNNFSMLQMNHQYVQPNALMNGQTSLNFPPTHHHHLHHHHQDLQQQYQTQHQSQYNNMAQCHQYMSGFQQQQQQQQYNNVYGQLQQQTTNSFQFNVEYLDSSDPQAYNDYYYGDYQYSDGYSDNLLDTGFPGTYATSTSRSTTPYGDETVEELGPEEVRWFYKVEGDKKWTPFIGYDSLRIEWKYRDLLQDVGINETRTASSPANKHSSPGTASTPSPPREKRQDSGEEKSQVVSGIVVRGGLYEVDVKHRKCESIYWEGEEYIILRGTWFYEGTWSPVEEGLADRMEQEHLTTFRGHPVSSIGTQKLEDAAKEIVHSLSVPEGEVDWFSAGEVYLSLHATPSRLMRSVGKKLGFQKTGCKLRRGYSVGASASDKPPDINHIVFVIHGIGQKMERGRIIKNCTGLRESVSHLKNKYFPSLCSAGQTVEFFPVEWRSSLVLDAGVIDNITPHKILHLRQMLNASFMDIMYYNSPLYREEIISGLTQEMNRLYTMFTCRNPYFEANGGKVSMVAHSLGCVITYDIVTGWHPARHSDQHLVDALSGYIDESESVGEIARTKLRAGLRELLCQHHHSRAQPTLNFKIENFFCLGSPLAVFLALRSKQEGQSEPSGRVSGGGGGVDASDLIPQKLCKRLLNIFHPSDPVAYRLEPLLCPEYANIAPILIHSHNGTDKTPYSEMPLEPIIRERESGAGAGGSATDGGRSKSGGAGGESSETATPVSSAPSTPVKGGSGAWSLWGLMKGTKKTSDAALQDLSSLLQQGKGLAERTDFVLREGSMESSYISALTSHTSYWTNYDVSHFILSILYPDILPTSSSSASVSVSSALRSDPPRTSVA